LKLPLLEAATVQSDVNRTILSAGRTMALPLIKHCITPVHFAASIAGSGSANQARALTAWQIS
jgi:hypothetical protein